MNDWTALQVQLARLRGNKVQQLAGELGCSDRSIFRLSKRKFPKIVLAILCQFFNMTVRKSSAVPPSKIQGTDQKETLRTGRLDEGPAVKRPAARCTAAEIDEIDALGAAIPDILRSFWAAQPL